MILVLVLVLPRMGSRGLSCLAGFARFSDPMFESLSVSVCCDGRVCTGGWLLQLLQFLLLVVLRRGCCCPVVVPGSVVGRWSVLVEETVQLLM